MAEIEKQFTRLEAGVAALRRVQANLKRYRAAVLKAACEGRLVPTEAELAKTESRKRNLSLAKPCSPASSPNAAKTGGPWKIQRTCRPRQARTSTTARLDLGERRAGFHEGRRWRA